MEIDFASNKQMQRNNLEWDSKLKIDLTGFYNERLRINASS